ncbi:MAG: family ATPase, partial [Oerskovia sp.]|nr:family ATPase [Oerskovia sp.]
TDAELRGIFERMATSADFEALPETLDRFEEMVSLVPRTEGFGNGRHARNVLDAAIARHAWRLKDTPEPTLDELRRILPEDLLPQDGTAAEASVGVLADAAAQAGPEAAGPADEPDQPDGPGDLPEDLPENPTVSPQEEPA